MSWNRTPIYDGWDRRVLDQPQRRRRSFLLLFVILSAAKNPRILLLPLLLPLLCLCLCFCLCLCLCFCLAFALALAFALTFTQIKELSFRPKLLTVSSAPAQRRNPLLYPNPHPAPPNPP